MKRLAIYIFFFLLLFSSNTYADFCTDFPLDPACPEPDPDAPIDSGVGLLIGAAAFYTVKKIRDKSEKPEEPSK